MGTSGIGPLRVIADLRAAPSAVHFDIVGCVEGLTKERALAALAALAHETRLEIFRCLVAAGVDGLPAGKLGDRLDLPCPTLSFHLKELRLAGIVTSEKQGRWVIYRADLDAVKSLGAYLTEHCCSRAACGSPERPVS